MHRFKNAMLGRSAFFFFANISFVKTLVCLRSEEKFTLQSMLVYSSQKISNHGQLSKNSISAIINHRAAIFSAKWLIIWATWIRTLSGLTTFKTAEKPQQIVVVRSMTMFDRGPLNGSLTVQHQLITSSQQPNSKETSAEIKRDETKSRRQERSMKRREFL